MSKTVLVTGVDGHIGGHVCKCLVENGFKVRGTVYDVGNTKSFKYLFDLGIADNELEIVEADLLWDASKWNAIVDETIDYVVHVASPTKHDAPDPKTALFEPGLQGTENVLKAANKSKSVKRIVLFSSVGAAWDQWEEVIGKDRLVTPEDWNTDSSLNRNPYFYTKTKAEQLAIDFINDQSKNTSKMELVEILPSYVIGPMLKGQQSFGPVNTELIRGLVDGTQRMGTASLSYSFVDVRDVAAIAVKAIDCEIPHKPYRIIASLPYAVHLRQVIDHIKTTFPQFRSKVPMWILPNFIVTYGALFAKGYSAYRMMKSLLDKDVRFDNSIAVNDLNIRFRDVYTTIDDAIKSAVENKLVFSSSKF